ncbi:Hypothetical predicted protein [Olea europaea subsp. europaea]|uniref:Uncharacterized protein n=1 Tax=Olea europaea subsp. europaea TaxID=158383 RepID=A0A8S0PPM0_OLEEU|nr:Hypothetical predicted protein [Olea europaea subsp. europaea]
MRSCLNSTNASVSGWVNDRLGFWLDLYQTTTTTYLYVHATLHSMEAERDLPYIASLVPFLDRPVQFLDDLAMSVVGPQFHETAPASGEHEGSAAGDGHEDEFGTAVEDDETSTSDDHQTPEGNNDDESKADDSGDSGGDTSNKTSGGNTEDDEDAS